MTVTSINCAYGENPQQKPASLNIISADALSLGSFQHVGGAEPSFNNWCDVDRLLQTATHIAAVFSVNTGKFPTWRLE